MSESKKLVREARSQTIVGVMGLGLHGQGIGTAAQIVYNGDTLNGRALGNVPVRFLGVDAPELKIALPGESGTTKLEDEGWRKLLADKKYPQRIGLSHELAEHLAHRFSTKAAENHYVHGESARRALEKHVADDVARYAQGKLEKMQFFLHYAREVADRYGRFLGYINVDLPTPPPEGRPPFYNERMLAAGLASPYFIWPNLDPFMKAPALLDAVIAPGQARELAVGDNSLARARRLVGNARNDGRGIYNPVHPLVLLPFEIRFLSRAAPPDRWVIDLSKNDDRLIEPERYYEIARLEDRLFIPAEYVPLFARAGWKGAEAFDAVTRRGTRAPAAPAGRARSAP